MSGLYRTGDPSAQPAQRMRFGTCAPVPGTDLTHDFVGIGVPGAMTGQRPAPLAFTGERRQPVQLLPVQLNGVLVQQQGTSGTPAEVIGTAKPSVVADVAASGVPPRGRPV